MDDSSILDRTQTDLELPLGGTLPRAGEHRTETPETGGGQIGAPKIVAEMHDHFSKSDLRMITTSKDPRTVMQKLKGLRFVARTWSLHKTFADAQGFVYLLTCLRRFSFHLGVCREAAYLVACFTQNPGCHALFVKEEIPETLIGLVCSHAGGAITDNEEVAVLIEAADALANLANSEHERIREICVEKGAPRLAALLNDVVLKKNTSVSGELRRKLERSARRLRGNLEDLCGVQKWDNMGKRNQKFYVNCEVMPLVMIGDPHWKAPKCG